MLNNLREIFRQYAEARTASKALKATFRDTLVALDSGDVEKVRAAAAQNTFIWPHATRLMVKAINTDSIDIFNAVLNGRNFKGDVNKYLVFSDSAGPDGPHYHSGSSLLYCAIEHKKPAIAQFLANNPATDITISGASTYSFYVRTHVESKTEQYPTPLERARALNLPSVIAPLARRTAELKQAEAQALIREAQGLRPS